MGKSSPSPPPPINYKALANDQTQSNIATANQQAVLNRPDQTGPTGSIDWTHNPNGTWSQTTSLSPTQQGLYNQANGISGDALRNLSVLSTPGMGTKLPTLSQNTVNPGVPVTSVGGTQNNVQGSLGLNGVQAIPKADQSAYNGAVNSVYGQATSRLDPQFNQQQKQLQTQLANQGIPQNSDAWNQAMDDFNRNKNDAYTSAFNNAVTQGSQVENNQFNMGLQANQAGVGNALASGNFSNAAQEQEYQQALQSGQFANSAAGQQLAQALANTGFNNQQNQQTFADSLQNTNQAIANQSTLAGLPNEFSQVSLPGIQGSSVQPTDVIGAQSLSAQQQLAQYQSQVAQNSAKKGGTGSLLGTLGGAAILAPAPSDRRVKRDIKRIGKTHNGLTIYSFRYAWDDKPQIGLMAQEVEGIVPEAVITLGGIKHVDYAKAMAA